MKILFCITNGNCKYILKACDKLKNNKKIRLSYYCSDELSIESNELLNKFSKKNKIKIFDFGKFKTLII